MVQPLRSTVESDSRDRYSAVRNLRQYLQHPRQGVYSGGPRFRRSRERDTIRHADHLPAVSDLQPMASRGIRQVRTISSEKTSARCDRGNQMCIGADRSHDSCSARGDRRDVQAEVRRAWRLAMVTSTAFLGPRFLPLGQPPSFPFSRAARAFAPPVTIPPQWPRIPAAALISDLVGVMLFS